MAESNAPKPDNEIKSPVTLLVGVIKTPLKLVVVSYCFVGDEPFETLSVFGVISMDPLV